MNDYLDEVQSKPERKNCREFISNSYVNCGLEKIDFIERHDYIINNNLELEKDVHFLAEQCFHIKYEPMVIKLKEKLAISTFMEKELMRYFNPDCMLQVGHKIDSLQDLEKLFGDKPPMKVFPIEEGKVHIIYIWSYYKSISKKQLSILNRTFSDLDPKLEGEVKFITINIDQNKHYALNVINLLKINKLENYFIDRNKYPLNPILKIADKMGCPLCILINNDNIIELCGSLFEVNLEAKIKQILDRNAVAVVSFYTMPCLNEAERKLIKKFLTQFPEKIEFLRKNQVLNASHLFGATVRYKKSFTAGNLKNKQYFAEVNFFCQFDDEKEVMNMFGELENITRIRFNREIVLTNEIFYGEMCRICAQNLSPEHNQYYCGSCDIHLCKKCGDSVSNVNHPDKVHNHYLFYLTKNCDYFRRFILNYNFKNKYEDVFRYFDENKGNNYLNECKTHFQVKCDGCMTFPIKTTRWKCCNCIFKNLCNHCKNVIEHPEKDNVFFDEIMTTMTSHGCYPLEHIFQKIIFDSFVY